VGSTSAGELGFGYIEGGFKGLIHGLVNFSLVLFFSFVLLAGV